MRVIKETMKVELGGFVLKTGCEGRCGHLTGERSKKKKIKKLRSLFICSSSLLIK